MKLEKNYTTALQAGLGAISETNILLDLWTPKMSVSQLYEIALESGYFSDVTARRLKNLVKECFASRYLINDDYPARILKELKPYISKNEFKQLLFIFTARTNAILYDFIRLVYWDFYSSGFNEIHNEEAKKFVIDSIDLGKTTTSWSDSTINRISSYLTGCCADFGLLESGRKRKRKILAFKVSSLIIVILAYDLHFSKLGDNSIVMDLDWELFGLQKQDVLRELKYLSLKGYFIIQTSGEITRISWPYKNWRELIDAIAKR